MGGRPPRRPHPLQVREAGNRGGRTWRGAGASADRGSERGRGGVGRETHTPPVFVSFSPFAAPPAPPPSPALIFPRHGRPSSHVAGGSTVAASTTGGRQKRGGRGPSSRTAASKRNSTQQLFGRPLATQPFSCPLAEGNCGYKHGSVQVGLGPTCYPHLVPMSQLLKVSIGSWQCDTRKMGNKTPFKRMGVYAANPLCGVASNGGWLMLERQCERGLDRPEARRLPHLQVAGVNLGGPCEIAMSSARTRRRMNLWSEAGQTSPSSSVVASRCRSCKAIASVDKSTARYPVGQLVHHQLYFFVTISLDIRLGY